MRATAGTADCGEHQAVRAWGGVCRAWRRIKPDCEPQNIEVLQLTSKNVIYRLTGAGSNGPGVIAKRCRPAIARVEQLIYETLLPRVSLPALSCYGSVAQPGGEFCWLFLEDAGAHEYSVDCAEHRALAGTWLGTLHTVSGLGDLEALLPDRGPGYYLNLLRFVRTALLTRVDTPVLSAEERALLRTVAAQCDVIESHWDEVEKFCDGVPRTLVHGDFVPKNLRIQPATTGPALLVFDWEMAGWGFPAADLAQVDLSACPDLDAYDSVLRHNRPHLDVRSIQRLTDYGNLLRLVDTIYWEAYSMKRDAYEFLIKPLMTIKLYEPQLAAAMRAVHWNSAD